MGFIGSTERDFVKKDLGPALAKSGYDNVKLMILDDNRLTLSRFTEEVLEDEDAAKYVSGIGVHWYEDFIVSASVLTQFHER